MKKLIWIVSLFVIIPVFAFSQGIISISPGSGNAGETVNTVITLDASVMPPLPPSDIQPESVKIGTTEAVSFNRTSNTSITASFDIPAATISGNYDVTVMFIVGGGTELNLSLSEGFEIIGAALSVFYVDGDSGLDSNDGLSWANAKNSPGAAISAANNLGGGNIWIKSGTYKPTTGADREISFTPGQNVHIFGGFNGTETDITERDPETNVCILSGDIGVAGDISDNSYHVIITAKNSEINGFTITGGNANGDRLLRMGGGIYLANDKATIANCKFDNNYADEGGAMYVFNINGATSGTTDIVTIENCEFNNNSAKNGGALVLRVGASSDISNCTFTSNSAEWRGGAVFIDYGAFETAPISFNLCTFTNNTTSGNGGAIYTDDMASQLGGTYWFVTDCDFQNNSATYRGGAISNYNNTGNYPDISTSNFTENSAGAGGNAIANDNGVHLTVNNNTFGSGQDINSDQTCTCEGTDCP